MKSVRIAAILIMFVFVACQKDNPINPVNRTFTLQSGTNLNKISDLMDDYLSDPNLIGVIEFSSLKRSDLSLTVYPGNVKVYNQFDGIDNYAYAGFRDPSNNPITVDNLLINASLLREYNPGAYAKVGSDEMDLYFDGSSTNKFYIENLNNSWLPDSVYDNVTFSNRIEMTNIQRYDSVSKSQGFEVQWTGGAPYGNVRISFSSFDTDEDSTNYSAGFYDLTENDGTHLFDSLRLSFIGPTNRLYDIEVVSYEPIIRPLANGKSIILLGVSKNRKTVFFKD